MNIKKIIETASELNPYPECVFSEPTKAEYTAMNRALKSAGLAPDKFFGSFGRRVWNNCLETIRELTGE